MPINIAAPLMNPSNTEGAMKSVIQPSLKAPTANCIIPINAVTAIANAMYLGLPGIVSGLKAAKSASEFAFVGPDMTWRLDPNKAATAQGTIAE